MEQLTINVEPRQESGKGVARSLRRAERIPAVIYRKGKADSLSINRKEMLQFIKTTAGEQVLVSVKYPDASTKMALLKTYQLDPVRGEILHADFMEVSMTEKVRVNVSITLIGEAVGIKRDKGILQHERNDLEVECLPNDIPGHFEVDISALGIGQSVHVRDIAVPAGVKILTDPGDTIALIAAPVLAEEVTEEVEAEAAEPEVVGKGKAEEEKEEAE